MRGFEPPTPKLTHQRCNDDRSRDKGEPQEKQGNLPLPWPAVFQFAIAQEFVEDRATAKLSQTQVADWKDGE